VAASSCTSSLWDEPVGVGARRRRQDDRGNGGPHAPDPRKGANDEDGPADALSLKPPPERGAVMLPGRGGSQAEQSPFPGP
jgi:hypothetical protein